MDDDVAYHQKHSLYIGGSIIKEAVVAGTKAVADVGSTANLTILPIQRD